MWGVCKLLKNIDECKCSGIVISYEIRYENVVMCFSWIVLQLVFLSYNREGWRHLSCVTIILCQTNISAHCWSKSKTPRKFAHISWSLTKTHLNYILSEFQIKDVIISRNMFHTSWVLHKFCTAIYVAWPKISLSKETHTHTLHIYIYYLFSCLNIEELLSTSGHVNYRPLTTLVSVPLCINCTPKTRGAKSRPQKGSETSAHASKKTSVGNSAEGYHIEQM